MKGDFIEKYKGLQTNFGTQFDFDTINGVAIPKDYIAFMQKYNGCEGDIGNTWVILDCEEDFIEYNSDSNIHADDRFSEAILIGSNGGGEYFGIDREGNYFMTPAIGGCEDTVYLGKSLEEFLEGLNEYFS